jgi:hypothetical protein
MKKKRVVYIKNCANCGREFRTTLGNRKFCGTYCRDRGRTLPTKRDTLCWKCKKATASDNCPWANDFIPVEGWDAEETVLVIRSTRGYERKDTSYIVRECPLFEEG